MSKLSVIIPAYNSLDKVLRLKRELEETITPGHTEILIQDDASPLYNGPLMFGECCERNSPNLGFPGNCNAGARRAVGANLLFLNQDIYNLPPGWDVALLRLFDENSQIGIVGPTLLFPNGHIQSVGGLFDGQCQPFHDALGYENPDWTPINTPRPVSWLTGAALCIRRGLWNLLGGFDERYGRGYFEDVDLCVRAQLEGAQVWHEPRVRMTHEVGSTGGSPSFMKNAKMFHRMWVATKYVQPDVPVTKERFWV
jgi:GT2 family glycosyltransferase